MRFKDLTGQVFERLKVLERVEDHQYPNGRHDVQYLCECSCGNHVKALGIHLRSGHTKSCGCLRQETTQATRTTHHMTNTPLYNTWRNMRSRCFDPGNQDYATYGGRGITVCEEWKNSSVAFIEWALKNGYAPGLSLDRIQVDGNYTPENCRWITQKEQCNNTRRNIVMELNGEAHTMKEWSELLGINYGTLQSRVARGWSHEKALTYKKANTH